MPCTPPPSFFTLSLLHWATEGEPVPSGTTLQIAVHLLQICNALSVMLRASLPTAFLLSGSQLSLVVTVQHICRFLLGAWLTKEINRNIKRFLVTAVSEMSLKGSLTRVMCGDTHASAELRSATMDASKMGDGVHLQLCF